MSTISVKAKFCAILISLAMAATLGLGAISCETASAHTNHSSHHATTSAVNLGKTKVRVVSTTSNSCTLKWTKVSGAQAYEIKCTPKSGGKTITKRVSCKVTRTKISGLKSGKSYVVKVRAYTLSNGSRHCASWSAKCSAKTKTAAHHSTGSSTNNTSCVYITNTGSKFHSSGCRSLRASKIPISRSDALSQGYGPCGICHP